MVRLAPTGGRPRVISMDDVRRRFEARCRRTHTKLILSTGAAMVGLVAWWIWGDPTVSDVVIGGTGLVTVIATFNLFAITIHQSHFSAETQEALHDQQALSADNARRTDELDEVLQGSLGQQWQMTLRHMQSEDAKQILGELDSSIAEVGYLFPRLSPTCRAWKEELRVAHLRKYNPQQLEEEEREQQAIMDEIDRNDPGPPDDDAPVHVPTWRERLGGFVRLKARQVRARVYPAIPNLRY